MISFIDTHAHLDLEHFGGNLADLLARCERGQFPVDLSQHLFPGVEPTSKIGLSNIILPATSLASSRNCIALAEQFPLLYAGIGIHPNEVKEVGPDDFQELDRLARHPRVVAIGETGLDKYWDTVPLEQQIAAFEQHIELAQEHNLPILVHSREADQELVPILSRASRSSRGLRGVIHAFSADWSVAKKHLDNGFYLSFAGSLTYTNKKFAPLREVAKSVPLDRLLLETDSPYLQPHPFRSQLENNEPLMLVLTAQRLAELRGMTLEEMARTTSQNARTLFGLNS